MKWNVALVLVFVGLLTTRYLLVHNHSGSVDDQQKIRIMPLVIKNGNIENDLFYSELLALDGGQNKKNKKGSHQDWSNQDISNVKREKKNENFLRVTMHNSKPFVQEKKLFLPSDKIYVSLVFPCLRAGKYNIVTHWKTPWGSIARKIVRKVNITEDAKPYRVYFWFQLVENSLFTRIFTGDEYKKKVYGQWEVLFYIDEEKVMTKPFVVAKL